MLTHPGIGDGVEQLIKPLFERRAPLGRIEIVARAFALPQNIDERPRLSETACESAGALIAHEVVGIRALRQESEAKGMALAQNRQHAVDGARCGSLAGPVAVEADDRFGREQPKLIHLAFGESGAERRHSLMEACLMQRDHVHVAFDHDELALVEGRPPRPGEVEHGGALVEQLGLRRVQIFRLGCRIERAGAEGDDAAARIDDRDGEPVAEAIVGGAAVLWLDEEPGIEELGFTESAFDESPFQRLLRVLCEADAEFLHRLGREPAPCGIVARFAAIARRELLFEIDARRLKRIVKAQAFLRRALVLRVWLRQRQAGLVRQPLNRFWKAQALGVHDEAENVAVLA